MTSSGSNSSSKARYAKSMAALKRLATYSPSERVFHKIDPDELREKAARKALWPAWGKMCAEDAAEKAKPSRPRPPCKISTRLALEALTRPRFTPKGVNHSQAKTRATLAGLVHKPRPRFTPIGMNHTRDKMRAALERLVRKPSPALRDCLSPGDYATAWAQVLEALRWFKGSVRLLMAARWASLRP